MSSEQGKCRWQDCEQDAAWGSEFCYIHRPSGTDALSSSVSAVAKWAGRSAAGAILVHLLKLIPHIGTVFNQHPDLITALENNPDTETLNRAISLLAEAEGSLQGAITTGFIKMEIGELRIDSLDSGRLIIREKGKTVGYTKAREIEESH